MSRRARIDAPGTLHHVIGRGIGGSKIFRSNKDREDFLRRTALLSSSRKRPVAKARRIFCQIAVKKLRYTGASVARCLGVTTFFENRMAGAEEIAGLERYHESSL